MLSMSGFLDPNAVSVEAEYTRYLDADILGKIVLKNFAINVLGLQFRDICIPVSRHGDVGNYKDFCDAGIRIRGRTYSVETKCSRHIVAKKTRAVNPSPRWNFGKLLYSARSGRERTDYEILFAVGVDSPGFEDSEGYWRHLHAMPIRHLKNGRPFDFSVWPHDAAFLERCGFYIMPRVAIRVDQLDVTLAAIERRSDYEFFSWGNDFKRLRTVWQHALEIVDSSPPGHVSNEP
jgi:hypothetical protein